MIKVKSTLDICINLIINKYYIIEPFELQEKILEVFQIDTHIYNIMYSYEYYRLKKEFLDEQERIKYKNLTYA